MPDEHGIRTALAVRLQFNVEEWFEGDHYETLADCATLELARVVFEAAIAKKSGGRFMIRNRTRVVQRHPQGDW